MLGGTSPRSADTAHTNNPSRDDSAEVNEKNLISRTTTSSSIGSNDEASVEKIKFENRHVNGCCSEVLMTDLLCAVCKQLLYRPVVLNCGHGNKLKLIFISLSRLTEICFVGTSE